MHTVTQLHQDLPEFKNNIRRSRILTKAAVIATSSDADRTLVVTSAVASDNDYHLVHMFDCPPRALMDRFPHEHNVLELRPDSWYKLQEVIRHFLNGSSEETLVEAAY